MERNVKSAALRLPAILLIAIAILTPFVASIVNSFVGQRGPTLAFYRTFLHEGQYLTALANTWIIAPVVAVSAVLIAFPACAFFSSRGPAVRSVFIGVVTLSMAISGLINVIAWQVMLSNGGPLAKLLAWTGLHKGGLNLLYTRPAVIIGTTQILFPYAAAILFAGMRRIDWDVILAAQTLGANPVRTFATAYWPQVRSSTMYAFAMLLVLASGVFVTPTLLGGPGDAMLGNVMRDELVNDFDNGANLAAASGTILSMTLAFATLAVIFGLDRAFYRRKRS